MSKSSYSSGITFPGMLAIVFIALKLCGVITWSWWWVLSPLWIPLAIVLALAIPLVIVLALAILAALVSTR